LARASLRTIAIQPVPVVIDAALYTFGNGRRANLAVPAMKLACAA
jgi:hypothetical protein